MTNYKTKQLASLDGSLTYNNYSHNWKAKSYKCLLVDSHLVSQSIVPMFNMRLAIFTHM